MWMSVVPSNRLLITPLLMLKSENNDMETEEDMISFPSFNSNLRWGNDEDD